MEDLENYILEIKKLVQDINYIANLGYYTYVKFDRVTKTYLGVIWTMRPYGAVNLYYSSFHLDPFNALKGVLMKCHGNLERSPINVLKKVQMPSNILFILKCLNWLRQHQIHITVMSDENGYIAELSCNDKFYYNVHSNHSSNPWEVLIKAIHVAHLKYRDKLPLSPYDMALFMKNEE